MATGRWYKCPACGHQRPKQPAMLTALKRLAEEKMPSCPSCQASMQLHLKFNLALGAKVKDAIALESFLPSPLPEWYDGERKVVFYPFLVIAERANGKRVAWLPYFHEVDGSKRKKKYGQWAPFMELQVFEDVLRQARKKGYLLDS